VALIAAEAEARFCDSAGLIGSAFSDWDVEYVGRGKWTASLLSSDGVRDEWTFDEVSGRAVALQSDLSDLYCRIDELLPNLD